MDEPNENECCAHTETETQEERNEFDNFWGHIQCSNSEPMDEPNENECRAHTEMENQEERNEFDNFGGHIQCSNSESMGEPNENEREMEPQEERSEFNNFEGNIQCSDSIGLKGRRIVDIQFFVEQMRDLNRHAEECGSRMNFIKETKLGLRSILYFECSVCGNFYKAQTSYKNDNAMNINKAATLGITSIGSGFYHLEEVCAHLDIPCMSSSTFDIENKKLQTELAKLAKCHTNLALKEEIALAKARGDVDSAGNVLLAAVCDGSWGKRSYGKGFSSLSGCATIIGWHTKKVLYFDTKNKYCDICTKSYAKYCPPNDHLCNISYVGPSSGMETEIIVEGFQACERIGVRFSKIISDGDSSVFKEISERYLYQNPELFVEKFDCTNHLYKNFRSKLTALCSDSKYNKIGRSLLDPSIGDRICKGIRMAAKHWRNSNASRIEKLENLEKDCLNAPYHHFGNHDNCSQYFCEKSTTAESNITIDLLKSFDLFQEIINYCNSYFASNVRSILEDKTNNAAEELNNVIAKYLGGKRVNYSLAGSYTGRVSAAVVQFNSKGHAGSEFHNFDYIIPNKSCLKVENSRIRHYAKNEAARKTKPRKRATKDKKVKDYGMGQKDLSEASFEIAKNAELARIDSNRINRVIILKDTVGQRHNNKCLEVRKKMINCNYFGRIVNARNRFSYANIVEEILHSPAELSNTKEVRHQRLYELQGLKIFNLRYKDFKLEQTGIFIDQTLGFLGASPLRLYGSDAILNVRCPVKAFKRTVDEAVSKKLIPFKYENGDLRINEKHVWYIELQGQLHITERRIAYLVVWLGTEFFIKSVTVNHVFWVNQMQEKLEFFFHEALLKELSDPRKKRKLPLRKYDPQTKTFN